MAYRLVLIPLVLLVAGSALAAQEPDREIESGGGWFILNPLHINDFQHWSSPSLNLAWTTWYTERSGWTVGAMPILGREPNRLTFFGHLTWRRRWLNNGEGNYIHLGLGAGPTIYRYRGFKAEPRHALWLWGHVELLATRRIRDGLVLRYGVTFTPLFHIPIAAQPIAMIVWK